MSVLSWLTAMTRSAQTPPTGGPQEAAAVPPVAALNLLGSQSNGELIAAAVADARNPRTDAATRLARAQYAYRHAHALFGIGHPTANAAARIYLQLLGEHGRTGEALIVAQRQLRISELLRDQPRILSTRCTYALALHRHGRCHDAHAEVRMFMRQWQASPHSFGHPTTVLLSAAAIHAGCGHTTAAIQVLTHNAGYLTHLAADARRQAARWLTTTVANHPARCTHDRPVPEPPHADETELDPRFWLSHLEQPGHDSSGLLHDCLHQRRWTGRRAAPHLRLDRRAASVLTSSSSSADIAAFSGERRRGLHNRRATARQEQDR
ncbi:MAG: hypothetical protein SYR96_05440 [Actinomycetota bacterium]|nr:hypothetical protein [Actinomycetota bacterium]